MSTNTTSAAARLHLDEPCALDRINAMCAQFAVEVDTAEKVQEKAIERWEEQHRLLNKELAPMIKREPEDKIALDELIELAVSLLQASPPPDSVKAVLTEVSIKDIISSLQGDYGINLRHLKGLKDVRELLKPLLKKEIKILADVLRDFDERLDDIACTSRRKP
ncbi:hypothetical protein ONZ45_g6292 [Pleurotus djamor]|nr:hypothetical protein ONZ45_g6292 [Pleurotus djamor]